MKIGLVIMASGLGKRFGGNKLMADLNNKPIIRWILDATENLFDKRVVITRSNEVKTLCESLNVDCVVHELPNKNDTVRLGISSLMDDVEYCFYIPGDQPLISQKTIVKLINEAKNNSDRIIRASYEDTVGAPVGFPKSQFNELLNLPEGKGGNWLTNKYQELVLSVSVNNEYELWDVDTVDDLERVKNIIK